MEFVGKLVQRLTVMENIRSDFEEERRKKAHSNAIILIQSYITVIFSLFSFIIPLIFNSN